jgi:hypothetical protein
LVEELFLLFVVAVDIVQMGAVGGDVLRGGRTEEELRKLSFTLLIAVCRG